MHQLKRKIQFSLRAIFLLTAVVSIWIGWQVKSARERRNAIVSLQSIDARIQYDFQADGYYVYDESGNRNEVSPPGPRWLQKLVGDEYFVEVIQVRFDRPEVATDQHMTSIKRFRGLQRLNLTNQEITDEGLSRIADLLELKELNLGGTSITDRGLTALKNLDQLVTLELNECVADAGLRNAFIERKTHLETLDLSGSQVTNKSMDSIEKLPNLWLLSIDFTNITEERVKLFNERRPNVQVVF